jgi:hypothetical protein
MRPIRRDKAWDRSRDGPSLNVCLCLLLCVLYRRKSFQTNFKVGTIQQLVASGCVSE